ncbi:DNA repair protein RecO [Ornithobacterium rhinotracheale]|uniref:DNA repair protein RecO n=1 Tax=Ornithobacterium rhinotracheale TaxID=28251 RepID=A0A3R6ATM3_ORNRH|nr:DNA repair protein RecO [Ornithobacterium rhinotracheale]QAR30343.1 DNA repair protein RecO [Ornithobacterium rhinotracheale]
MKKTRALVIKHLKYGDSGLILHLYTRELGMLAFMIKGFYKQKKRNRSLLFPFAEVEISVEENTRGSLKHPKNLQTSHAFIDLHTQPAKSIVLQLLSEIINSCLRQDEANPQLYDFIFSALTLLDQKPKDFADFHLYFLLKMSHFLGFHPNTERHEAPLFDLEGGEFCYQMQSGFTLNEEESLFFKKLIFLHFDLNSTNVFNQAQRRFLLNSLLQYYQLHLPDFREPKSLEVIKLLF